MMSVSQPQPDERGAQPVESPPPKTRKALSRVKRELSEEDPADAGVQKMLIEELERAEEENSEPTNFREKFHDADKQLAMSKQKLKSWVSMVAEWTQDFLMKNDCAEIAVPGWARCRLLTFARDADSSL